MVYRSYSLELTLNVLFWETRSRSHVYCIENRHYHYEEPLESKLVVTHCPTLILRKVAAYVKISGSDMAFGLGYQDQ